MSRLKANDDPIDGVAILEGKNPDLLMLRVRLPPEQRDLAKAIIRTYFSGRATTPGNSIPARNSNDAPPPVEM